MADCFVPFCPSLFNQSKSRGWVGGDVALRELLYSPNRCKMLNTCLYSPLGSTWTFDFISFYVSDVGCLSTLLVIGKSSSNITITQLPSSDIKTHIKMYKTQIIHERHLIKEEVTLLTVQQNDLDCKIMFIWHWLAHYLGFSTGVKSTQ